MSHHFCSFRLLALGGSTENGNMIVWSLPSHGPTDTRWQDGELLLPPLQVGLLPLAARTR